MMKAVYPGSFDPITNGHLDIIERAAGLCDELEVSVAVNIEKTPLFSVPERVDMLREVCAPYKNVKIDHFHGLLVDYVEGIGAQAIVRGLRAVSDFDFEFQMALMNKRLKPAVETVFLPAASDNMFISSSLLKELSKFDAPIKDLVPPSVEERLKAKLRKDNR
ncbi:MAG: pantetheine-phosphate adenylyltransferase [Abditibacteriota bacterium]|nr:pantetheine-phosphate adenylyltransferase [Abditibacteriota bacterium]